MQAAIDIQIDKAKMAQIEQALKDVHGALPRIVYLSLIETAKKGRTQIDRDVRAILMVKKRDVMKRITDDEKATYTKWLWRLGISPKRLTLASFGSISQTSTGVTYMIKKGLRKIALHAFISKGFTHWRSGEYIESKIIWRRARRAPGSMELVPRVPLIVPKGPSIGQVVRSGPILANIERQGAATLSKEIDTQIKFELSKRMPK